MKFKVFIQLSMFLGGLLFLSADEQNTREMNASSELRDGLSQKLRGGSINDLAKKAGFASRVPKSTEVYVSCQGLDQLVRSMFKSEEAKMLEEMLEEGGFLAEALTDDDYVEFMRVAGDEFFIAGGEGASGILTALGKFSSGLMQYELGNEFLRMVARLEGNDEWWRVDRGVPKFITNRQGMLTLCKELKISPVYAGFKVSAKEERDSLVKMLQGFLSWPVMEQNQDFQVFSEVKSDEEGGFSGFKFDGAKVVKALKALKAEGAEDWMIKELGQELYSDFAKEVAKRQLVLMVGVVGDYIVFYAGSSEKDIRFAKSPEESVLARPGMKFARNYTDKELKGLVFLSDEAMQDIAKLKVELSAIANAYADTVGESDFFGDTREIQDFIRDLGQKSEFLFDLLPKSRLGAAVYLENGLVIDSYLGKESAMLDLESKRKLVEMAHQDGSLISGNWIFKPSFTKQCSTLLETATKTAYKIMHFAIEQDFHDDEWLNFSAYFRIADRAFSQDLVRAWKSAQKGLLGLGDEHAVVVDLKGNVPSLLKNMPKPIIEHGLIPRVAYVSTTKSRAELSKAWIDMSAVAKDIGHSIGKIAKKEIALPQPQLEKQGDLDLWSYAFEGLGENGKPTLGISENYFFLSSSPQYVKGLAAMGATPVNAGADLVIRMKPLRESATHWLTLFQDHGQKFLDDSEWQDFQGFAPIFKKALQVSKKLDKVSIRTRMVDKEIRNTIHFKTN